MSYERISMCDGKAAAPDLHDTRDWKGASEMIGQLADYLDASLSVLIMTPDGRAMCSYVPHGKVSAMQNTYLAVGLLFNLMQTEVLLRMDVDPDDAVERLRKASDLIGMELSTELHKND